jgi:2-polyprenyl-3-methyl-5-hydroxy-6-metoxy-1,4-benzoquinol methylase
MPLGAPGPGRNTATPLNVQYRTDRISPYLSGKWLDYGCAEGGYSEQLLHRGASEVVGVDVDRDRIELATEKFIQNASFVSFDGTTLGFENETFDGAFVNEVLEHVADESQSLKEIFRVLRPGGYLVLMSPNRWFPVEGHAIFVRDRRFGPVPLVPWLPERLTRHFTSARNYWPRQLVSQVRQSGFAILETAFIWPVLEQYPWLPPVWIERYQRRIRRLDQIPIIRRLGVSTLVVAVRPAM